MILNKKQFNSENAPFIMGILNVTPDSFSDGGKFYSIELVVAQAKKMLQDGADLIDIGGESTRPGALAISSEQELARVLPVIEAIVKKLPQAVLSIDTYKPAVADIALSAGCSMVNDIWGLQWAGDKNHDMAAVVAKHNAAICIMHNRVPADGLALEPLTNNAMLNHILNFFDTSITIAQKAGIKNSNIILDPGIGFGGKSVRQNLICASVPLEILLKKYPVLIGLSNKSFIGEVLEKPVEYRQNGTLAANTLAIKGGATFIRVHDVAAHNDAIKIYKAMCGG